MEEAECPITFLTESVETKYVKTTTNVKINSTPKRSQAAKEAL